MSVANIFGGPNLDREPNENLIQFLEDALERAKSGEVTGMVTASLWQDKSASWNSVGLVGSFAMVGALEIARRDLATIVEGKD